MVHRPGEYVPARKWAWTSNGRARARARRYTTFLGGIYDELAPYRHTKYLDIPDDMHDG